MERSDLWHQIPVQNVSRCLPRAARVECQPLCRIVVAADNKSVHSPAATGSTRKLVKQFHRLCRRHRFVIDIPGGDHPIRLFLIDPLQDLLQYVLLVFICENPLTRLPRCRSDRWISFMLDLPSRRRLGAPFVVTVYHLTSLHASLTPFYMPSLTPLRTDQIIRFPLRTDRMPGFLLQRLLRTVSASQAFVVHEK